MCLCVCLFYGVGFVVVGLAISVVVLCCIYTRLCFLDWQPDKLAVDVLSIILDPDSAFVILVTPSLQWHFSVIALLRKLLCAAKLVVEALSSESCCIDGLGKYASRSCKGNI